jgi:hypothetical protein
MLLAFDGGEIGPPKGFGYGLNPLDAHSGQVHLDHRFFHRGLPPPVALDDCGLEYSLSKFWHLELHLVHLG